MLGVSKGHPNHWGKEWFGHNQPILLHFEGCNFEMGGNFHWISPSMHICRTRSSFLQIVLEGANKQTNVYGFENHQTSTRRKNGCILWTHIETSKLLESQNRW